MLTILVCVTMTLTTNFEKDRGGGGEEDQKRFEELPRAEARQLRKLSIILMILSQSIVHIKPTTLKRRALIKKCNYLIVKLINFLP